MEPFRALLALENFAELSHRAYHLRFSRAYHDLKRFNLQNLHVAAGRHICHYLGRLASWAKSTCFIVEMASRYDLLTSHVKVRYVPCPRSTFVPNGLAFDDPLEHLTACLIRAGVHDPREQCRTDWRPLLETYAQRWKSIECGAIVHAEMIMLDHFDRHDLPFAHGKRYIGCSKPSCFCCAIYMANHPLKPTQRPSHNNVWVKWLPPRQSQQASARSSEANGSIIDILSESIKQNIMEQLSRGALVPRRRVFDSMTDLSASLPTAFDSVMVRSIEQSN
jgi:hypothetical protein